VPHSFSRANWRITHSAFNLTWGRKCTLAHRRRSPAPLATRCFTVAVSSVAFLACDGFVGADVDSWRGADGGVDTQKEHADETWASASDTNDGAGEEHANPDGSSSTEKPSTAPASGTVSDQADSANGDAMETDPAPKPTAFPVHRMTAAEYNNTVSALFGVRLTPADAFPAAGTSEFDANVGVLASLSQVSVQGYLNAARDVASTVFADDSARARIVTCDLEQSDELTCVAHIVEQFGARAFRRPLESDEIDRFVNAYAGARETLELPRAEALEHTIRAMLSTPSFFMRIELTPGQLGNVATERFALASRLSYLLWTSMPDQELMTRATNGELSTAQDVTREVERMLDDPQSAGFYRDFFGQWLGLRALESHNADPEVFPDWDVEVRAAMLTQATDYFASFVNGPYRYTDFLTAPHPQVATLSAFYAAEPEGVRSGFLTLPAFLTASSLSERTSPTSRATAVLGGLLCTNIAPPANVDIPDLGAQEGQSAGDNIRERLSKHRQSPDCASCHEALDPIGLSLENFDAVGGYRTTYPDGSTVDASGEFNGQAFEDIRGLVAALSNETRLASCPSTKLLTYALRRSLSAADRQVAATISTQWNRGSLQELVKLVATSATFMTIPSVGSGEQ
jgi:hypothetical protein